jgi:purine-nucleoside phosphorylase
VYSTIRETVDTIRLYTQHQPMLGLILGSGLGLFADSFQNKTVIPFSHLPHFPSSTVLGHPGNLIFGNVEGVPVVALQGRAHLYEGYSAAEVSFPTRVLGVLGIRQLIVTNAAGGINTSLSPGDLMLITDHINLMGANPLTGPNIEQLGPRFPDMSEAYDGAMRRVALDVARQQGMDLREGIYIGLAGPSYETPAEIRMCRALGADAVGMSTIPEVIVANHMGIRVLGLSCITNMAAGMLPQKLTHEEVMNTTERAREKFESLLQGIIPRLAG